MTNLVVRRPAFRIDETVPFQWQPANPAFGVFANAFTFLAPAFERYIVAASREAMPRITDPAVAAEADAFLRQEAQHARAHRAHAKALIAQFPDLADTLAKANAMYDDLFEREGLDYHLAYIADLEATFTPLFKMIFDNRASFFAGGDDRVGTLFLWHFAEEIEHRSSALIVQRHITPDPRYRLRQLRRVLAHVAKVFDGVLAGFEQHVPAEAAGIPLARVRNGASILSDELKARVPLRRRPPDVGAPPRMLERVPTRDLAVMTWHVARSQLPRHDPADAPLPEWADEWFSAYDAGADVTTYEGARL